MPMASSSNPLFARSPNSNSSSVRFVILMFCRLMVFLGGSMIVPNAAAGVPSSFSVFSSSLIHSSLSRVVRFSVLYSRMLASDSSLVSGASFFSGILSVLERSLRLCQAPSLSSSRKLSSFSMIVAG